MRKEQWDACQYDKHETLPPMFRILAGVGGVPFSDGVLIDSTRIGPMPWSKPEQAEFAALMMGA